VKSKPEITVTSIEQLMQQPDVRKWFDCLDGKTKTNTATVRLIAFPHFGTTSRFCNPWIKLLPPHVELWAIKLPARLARYACLWSLRAEVAVRLSQLFFLCYLSLFILLIVFNILFTIELLSRTKDPLEPEVAPILDAFLCPDVIAFLNEKPYAFLGNSLGAWLAYEAVLEIAKRDAIKPPVYFFPCASSPSHKRYVFFLSLVSVFFSLFCEILSI
jgi:hypothetical protein